jgi:hypothetical protein
MSQVRRVIPVEVAMRSELVFDAMTNVSNRFLLTKLASKATRRLHRPYGRIQETTNAVLVRFGGMNPIARTEPRRDTYEIPVAPRELTAGVDSDSRSTPDREIL